MLMVQGEENTKMNLVFPYHKAFCAMVTTYVNTATSLLGANRIFQNYQGKMFSIIHPAWETFC